MPKIWQSNLRYTRLSKYVEVYNYYIKILAFCTKIFTLDKKTYITVPHYQIE